MTRLTEKRQDGSYVCINGEFHNIGEHINKLGKLEDIEEERHIDLIILFKALKNGFYSKEYGVIKYIEPCEFVITFGEVLGHFVTIQELYFEDLDSVLDTTGRKWYLEDYGKTWALTLEELENEN